MYRLYKDEVLSKYGLSNVEIYPITLGNVTFVGSHMGIMVGKQSIIMNHFPLRIWKNDARTAWMLSGHSHLTDIDRRPESQFGKCFDIGWDYKKDVWSFSEIEDVMSTKEVNYR